MGVENQIALSAVHCGACDANNSSSAKFCKGCGQSLYEPCVGCGKHVLLTQKFCDSCGADLEQALQDKHDRHDQWMAEAVAAAKGYDFDRATSLLDKVAALGDYRFKETADSAKQAVNKVSRLREQAITSVSAAIAQAKVALEGGNQAEAVRLLQSVPPKLMSDEAQQLLARVKSFTDQMASLENDLRPAIANKDWSLVGGLINQLLELAPDEKQYVQLGQQVAARLVAVAKSLLNKGQYAEAAAQLDSIPRLVGVDNQGELRSSVDNAHWLSRQFGSEPYVTPMLGRLAVRFAKETSDDPGVRKLVQQLAARLKETPPPARMHVPNWRAPADGWMGGQVGMLSLPTSIDFGNHPIFKSCPGRFTVAIGLALQGLGRARITENFATKKGGLFKSLGRKKAKKACWGIDIGSASMKAVLLEENDDETLVVIDSFFEEFGVPLCRVSAQEEGLDSVRTGIGKFLEAKDVEDIPIWVNISASKLVSRFVRLPPVRDKAAAALVEQEIDQKIPIGRDELAIVRWIADLADEGDLHGRPAVITAAKSHVITERLEMLEEAGLTVTGLQADTIALVNFVVHEFSDVWTNDANEDGQGDRENESTTPAIAIVDCGAASTSLILVSGEAHWSWTIETGGEDFTSRLARSTKTTHGDAEELKRNPAALTMPAKQYESLEQRQEELRIRLETSFADSLKQNPRFDVMQSWCVGGGCLCHGWIRRTMLA